MKDEELKNTVGNLVKWLADYHELSINLLEFEHPADKVKFYKFAEKQVERQKEQWQLELGGWIKRNHLGKGFDGSDRWEHCAAEIIQHIEQEAQLLMSNRGEK